MTTARPFRGSSSRLVVLAALAVLAGLLPGTASAAPQRGLLVVEGEGNRSAVVDIPEGTQVQTAFPTLTGGDRYAGFVVERLVGTAYEEVFAAATVRAFRDATAGAGGFTGGWQPAAGRYRLTLLGDAPVRVEWQLTDPEAAGIAVTPRTPVAARFFGRAEPLASGLSEARVDLPRAAPAGKRVLQVALLAGTRADELTMCATAETECPRPVLPVCLPSPAPCSPAEQPAAVPVPTWHSTGEASGSLRYTGPAGAVRDLRWAVEGYREEPDRLRAAAIVF